MNIKTFSVLDIETIRCTDDRLCDYLTASVKPDSRLKDPAKVESDIAEKREAAIEKSSLDGGFGMIAMIGLAGVNRDLASIIGTRFCNDTCDMAGERELLRQFWDYAYKLHDTDPAGGYTAGWTNLVGHNIKWDARFIMQRTVVHGLGNHAKPALFDLNKRYSDRVHDTMEMWAGWNERISLDRLCTILGVESPKGKVEGSMVHDLWTSGEQGRDMVREYNWKDLQATAACFVKMMEGGMV